jgi:UPF0271 protein
MGESTSFFPYSMEKDLEIMNWVSSINLACGFHAGDAHTMHRLVEAAMEKRLAIGAHPAFPDKENFGRKEMRLTPEMLYDIIIYQVGALQGFLQIYGSKLHHVKVHGALYNLAAREVLIAEIISRAIRDFDDSLLLYALSGSEMIRSAEELGLKTASEAFADRTYLNDGSLTPRNDPNALIEDESTAINQAWQLVKEGTVTALGGNIVKIKVDTICIHGDTKQAIEYARAIHETLTQGNFLIQQPC